MVCVYCPVICLEGLREATECLRQDNFRKVFDCRSSENEVRMLK